MAAEAKRCEDGYTQALVRVMREHSLIEPDEEREMIDYLFCTQ